jgi:hypothetical protein
MLYSEELFPSTAWTAGDQINKCIVESAQFDECAALFFCQETCMQESKITQENVVKFQQPRETPTFS